MRRVLIVHASTYGQTAKIAGRIAEVLWREGLEPAVMRADEASPTIDLTAYAGVIVASPVFIGGHPKAARRFVLQHRALLESRPSAFVQVSGSAAGKELRHVLDCERMIAKFLAETHWTPARTASVAGAFAYTQYGFLLKWMMKRIAMREGGPTDTTRDHELTDWGALEEFARGFAALLKPAAGTPARLLLVRHS